MPDSRRQIRAQPRRPQQTRHPQPARRPPQRGGASRRGRTAQLLIDDRRASLRRRLIAATVALIVVVIIVIAALPYAKRAIQHFELPLQYATLIRQEAHKQRLDPALIAAVIYAETRFQPRTSSAGAEGLMQLEPATALFLAKKTDGISFKVADLAHPAVNIAYGSYYLRYLLNEYNGSEVLALAAYNGGETNVDKWITQVQERGQKFKVQDIPFGQTRSYVTEVMQKQREYHQHYPKQLGYS